MIRWFSILWEYAVWAILPNMDILPQIMAAVKR